MQNIATSPSFEKRQAAAPRVFSEGIGQTIPAHLSDLDAHARARIGALLDAKRIRLLLDRDGHVIVARAVR